ncbi:MAG TPA: hypothetical protein VGI92_05830 [Gemmatimonadales bacterium]
MMVQQTDSTRARLQARGLPADLAAQVTVVAQQTAGQGLPAQAIVDKAVEGFYKHVPPSRIEAAVRDLSQRLGRARAELRSGGVADASGGVIAGSADASAQGIARGDQVAMIHAAPDDESAASGLSVAAALVVQGIDPRTSAQLVTSSFAHGRTLAQVLDLPAAARALQVRGTSTTEVGRQLLDGISAAGTVTGRTGVTARPVVPPVRVP